jgi:hypothetical protein
MKIEGLPVIDVEESQQITVAVRACLFCPQCYGTVIFPD